MRRTQVQARLNGAEIDFLCEPRQSCSNGNCGACSVMLNGRLVNSCCVLAVEAQGAEVLTIEGVADGERLHPLQQAFLEEAALQCGICTPGFIIAAKALLEREPDATEERIRYWLAGNLCRCTGYDKIVKAVQRAAAEMKGSAS
ncbi:(2Fe-2S)-binding protein [bacterium]|nr:MAG: (2Fe-2S)-binding protein [bacterium]